jgi:hypothetical protein
MTKTVVRRHLAHVSAPAHLRSRIAADLASASSQAQSVRGRTSRFAAFFANPFGKAAFVLSGVAAVLVFFYFTQGVKPMHLHPVPDDGSIINETYSSFDGMNSGTEHAQFASNDPGKVEEFINKHLCFKAHVPQLKNCKLVGASASRYQNSDYAQVMYKNDQGMVYLCEAQLAPMLCGSGSFKLPDPVRKQIAATGWYTENHIPTCSLVAWQSDSGTICVAMAPLTRDEMLACLHDAR